MKGAVEWKGQHTFLGRKALSKAVSSGHVTQQEHTAIVTAIQARRDEFVQDAIVRSTAVGANTRGSIDPAYTNLLPATLCAAYGFLVRSIESGASGSEPIPQMLLTQAQTAAAVGLSLDELLRRCLAVNSLLTVYLLQ
jgi:hypothetical protein